MSKSAPNWDYERAVSGQVCGVDEAGRGPLAGPVIAAAVILDPQNIPKGLNDSKALSQTRREHLLNEIRVKAHIGVGIAEPEEIDRVNILAASLIAMRRAVIALPCPADFALIDGNKMPDLPCPGEAIVKGDSKSLSIAAASIVAKVTRDRIMVEAEARFPGYGFSQHKGYPTPFHREKLAELGACPIHRRSYAPVRAARINQA